VVIIIEKAVKIAIYENGARCGLKAAFLPVLIWVLTRWISIISMMEIGRTSWRRILRFMNLKRVLKVILGLLSEFGPRIRLLKRRYYGKKNRDSSVIRRLVKLEPVKKLKRRFKISLLSHLLFKTLYC